MNTMVLGFSALVRKPVRSAARSDSGVAIGPWQLVRDDIAAGVLAAPAGFVEDGSRYWLLSPQAPAAGSAQQALLDWLRTVSAPWGYP